MNLEDVKTLGMLIKQDKKIFDKALKKVDKMAKKDPDDPKKWEFVRCHIGDAYYDCVWKYDILENLENDVNWYGFEEVCGWLEAIQNAGPDRIVKEAIKDYHPKDWADCSIDEIGDESMEFLRPLWQVKKGENMLSNNEHSSLMKNINALAKEDGWDKSDAALLVLAYLAESGCLTDYYIDKVSQALERYSELGISKTEFIERVLKDADKVRQTGGF